MFVKVTISAMTPKKEIFVSLEFSVLGVCVWFLFGFVFLVVGLVWVYCVVGSLVVFFFFSGGVVCLFFLEFWGFFLALKSVWIFFYIG